MSGTETPRFYETMTVADLIAKLQEMPAHADVQVDLGTEFCGFRVEHAEDNGDSQLVAIMLDPARMDTDEGLRLEVAAPDLLKAAKRALAVFKAQGESVQPGNVLGALDAAITLATGGK